MEGSIPTSLPRDLYRKIEPQAPDHKGGGPDPPSDGPISRLGADHLNLYNLLSVTQHCDLEFMPISWETGRESLGAGISGRVNQSVINVKTSLAFKRPSSFIHQQRRPKKTKLVPLVREDEGMLLSWLTEIIVLRMPQVQKCRHIIDLEGIAWEFVDSSRGASVDRPAVPVLVYRKAQYGSLNQYFERNAEALTLEKRVQFCLDLVTAVETLHSCNIVHGDVKPENIVVFLDLEGETAAKLDDQVVIKMIDFGSSSFGLDDNEEVSFKGTPLWSAPENQFGSTTLAEAKKMEVYTCGLLCLWMLCYGSPLPTQLALGREDGASNIKPAIWTNSFVSWVRSTDNLQEVMRYVQSLNGSTGFSGVQEFLSSTLCKVASKRPNDWSKYISLLRQTTIQNPFDHTSNPSVIELIHPDTCDFQVLHSLADFEIADFRIRESIIRILEEAASAASCQKCSANSAFQLAICHSIGFGGVSQRDLIDDLLSRSRRTPQDLAGEIARFSKAPHDGLSPRLQTLVGGYSLDLEYLYQRDNCLGRAEVKLRKEISHRLSLVQSDHPSVIRLRYSLGQIYESLDHWQKAREMYDMVREARKSVFGADAHATLIVEAKYASCLVHLGQLAEGEEIMCTVLDKLKMSKGLSHKSTIATMGHLASVYSKQGRFKDAERLLSEQLVSSTEFNGPHHVETLTIMLNQGLNQLSAGEWENAEGNFRKAGVLQRDMLENDDREILTRLHLLCRTLIEQGDHARAQKICQQELEIYRRNGRMESSDAFIAQDNLSMALYGMGKLQSAITTAERAAKGMEEAKGSADPDTLVIQNNLARLYLAKGDLDKALQTQEQVVDSLKSASYPSGFVAPGFKTGLGNIYVKMGKWDQAEVTFKEAIELAKDFYGEHHPWTLYIHANLNVVYKSQRRLDQARREGEDLLRLLKSDPGLRHEKTLTHMRNLSDTYLVLGDAQRALQLQEQIALLRSPTAPELEILQDTTLKARIQYDLGYHEIARDEQSRASSRLRELCGADAEDTLNARYDLAVSYAGLEQYAEAERIHQEDLPHHVTRYTKHHDLTLRSMTEIARMRSRQKNKKAAKQAYGEVARIWAEMGLERHPTALRAQTGLALQHVELGEIDEAMETVKRVRDAVKDDDTTASSSFHVDENLKTELETIEMLILWARMDPRIRDLLEQIPIAEIADAPTEG